MHMCKGTCVHIHLKAITTDKLYEYANREYYFIALYKRVPEYIFAYIISIMCLDFCDICGC